MAARSFKNLTYSKKKSQRRVDKPSSSSTTDVANQMENLSISKSKKKVHPEQLYQSQVLASKRFFALSKPGVYAMADCEKSGVLTKGYCLVESKLFFNNHDNGHSACSVNLLLCSCNFENCNRLRALSEYVEDGTFMDFVRNEEEEYCVHRRVLKKLPCFKELENEDEESEPDEDVVDQLSVDPLLVAVLVDDEYGLVQGAPKLKLKLKCLTCAHGISRCDHVTTYRSWTKRNNISLETQLHSEPRSKFASVSYKRIPFPLPAALQEKYNDMEYFNKDFPMHLIPAVIHSPCCHGNKWDVGCPVTNRWIRSASTKIFKLHATLDSDELVKPRCVYFRPTVGGKCQCTLEYDGQKDLLFNLDGHNLVYYDLLFHYMYDMVDTGMPLASFSRVCHDTNKELSGRDDVIPLHILRRSWNAFARLLDLDYTKLYQCGQCGSQPDVIICDATSVGVQKNLLTAVSDSKPSVSGEPIKGSRHVDRVFFKVPSTRKLLLMCGFKAKTRKQDKKSKGLNRTQLRQLLRQLVSDGHHAVAALIERYARPGQKLCDPYGKFFAELARNSPVCGTFQIAGEPTVQSVVRRVACGEMDIRQPSHGNSLTLLQKQVPVLADFLTCLEVLTSEVKDILFAILDRVNAPFTTTNDRDYAPAGEEGIMTFFPGLPVQRGLGVYEADKSTKHSHKEESCRKDSWGHHSLSPGIFTVYCSHGICHGFSVLESNESPRHPFEIFVARFKTAPSVIIYDNSCKLHQYVLNREPEFFKGTKFFVDRFHWRGHTACSDGYNLSAYKSMNLVEINSQINEQENAGVQKLKGHLAYMLPDNFRFHLGLYYAIRNLRKK